MSLTELIESIHQLTPDEQDVIRRELDRAQRTEFEEPPELLAAIDEGIRSFDEGPTVTLDELRERMRSWTSDSK